MVKVNEDKFYQLFIFTKKERKKFSEVYKIPPIWSKNRSQCVMALFDEPIFGQSVVGPEVYPDIKAYDISLPNGILPSFERHSQHPMRPCFRIDAQTCRKIEKIIASAKSQFNYINNAFTIMIDKLNLSRKIITAFESRKVDTYILSDLERELRIMIRKFVDLQVLYTKNWFNVAKFPEIEKSLNYFAQIIARLDYLRDWLSIQRESLMKNLSVDFGFETYQTAGYTTLPTY